MIELFFKFLLTLVAYFGVQLPTETSCLSDLSFSSSPPTFCFAKEVFYLVNSTCEYLNNCTVIVTSSQLGDPCYG